MKNRTDWTSTSKHTTDWTKTSKVTSAWSDPADEHRGDELSHLLLQSGDALLNQEGDYLLLQA